MSDRPDHPLCVASFLAARSTSRRALRPPGNAVSQVSHLRKAAPPLTLSATRLHRPGLPFSGERFWSRWGPGRSRHGAHGPMRCGTPSPRRSRRRADAGAAARRDFGSAALFRSRTPVREALKQLAAMDLGELRPHRGAVVAGLEATRLAELFEAMEEVEAVCSRLAAGKMSRAERERFEASSPGATRRCAVPTTSRPFTPPTWRSTPRSTRAPTRLPGRGRLGPAAQARALSRAQFGLSGRPDNAAAEHRVLFEAIGASTARPPSRRCTATSAASAAPSTAGSRVTAGGRSPSRPDMPRTTASTWSSRRTRRAHPANAVFAGGGAMGAAMAAYDWRNSPLGLVASWPQSLKTAVGIMLTSRYQMWMLWGPELTFFCNDAYRPTLGVKGEWALGARSDRVWAEIWPRDRAADRDRADHGRGHLGRRRCCCSSSAADTRGNLPYVLLQP